MDGKKHEESRRNFVKTAAGALLAANLADFSDLKAQQNKTIKKPKTNIADALKYGFLAAMGLGILAVIFASQITRIFTTDPEVTRLVISYIWTVSLSYGFLAATMVEANAFQAIGRSWPGFWIFFLKFLVISVPIAYITTQLYHLPIMAIWIAIILGNIIPSVVGYFWINRAMSKIDIKSVPVH